MSGRGLLGMRLPAGFALSAAVLIAVTPASAPVWLLDGDDPLVTVHDAVELPELPAPHERAGHLFDEDDCLRLPPSGGDNAECGAQPLPGQASSHVEATDRNLAGFRGPHYTTDVSRDEVVVLGSTVRIGDVEGWSATGLVRNETPGQAGRVTVHARLVDEQGAALTTVRSHVPVDPLRPGEPAPFALEANEPVDEVADVRWHVEWGGAQADPARESELLVHWLRSHGGSRDVAVGNLLDDETADERPYLLFGSVRNHADQEIVRPSVVIAWLEEHGQVRHVARTRLLQPGSGDPLDELAPEMPGELGDFLHAEPADPGAELSGRMPMLWVVGA